ncbi:toxic anion resistance protein [Siminovitchia acidinfaciens]|uniref:Toxic anion resistance protein n=1 Tax=Siminovitchia acidinfaciens TaxID=2321395 RepID=A0A429XYC5_9BACI|nr:toxic anion resistance protein [Siminovitchia acidinfaciens]RST73741.1 toxic anion resistance protein [Siminovitchia acidinfaciens]
MSEPMNEKVLKDDFTSGLDDLLANPFGEQELALQPQLAEEPSAPKPVKLVDALPEESKKRALDLAKQIDPANHQAIISYGTQAQSQLLNFSSSMLDHVQNKDIGPIGDVLNDLMSKLKSINPEELSPEKKNFFSKMFGKISNSIQETMSKYQKTGAQIDRISIKLNQSKDVLLSDLQMLEQLYEKNKEYFHALNIFIAAGELKIEEMRTETIPSLKKKAEASGDQMAYQDVNDMIQFADRLEKRLYDLKLSRQITIQSAPQIRMIQNTNQVLAEKIQTSIMTAIPLWKNQIAIALSLFRQRQAVEAQKQVSKTTNELLLKNAEMLKSNTLEAAREGERGLVDIETLKKTQANLISTLEETIKIQQEGRSKRAQAEQELVTMENELKQKLLSLK